MGKRLVILLVGLFLMSLASAAPSIESLSGIISDGDEIVVGGLQFGSNGPDIVVFDDFEDGINGYTVNTGTESAEIGEWSNTVHSGLTTYSNAQSISGSLSARCDMLDQDGYGQLLTDMDPAKEIFMSWWMFVPSGDYYPGEDHVNGVNWKLIWLLGETLSDIDLIVPVLLSNGNWYLSGNHDCTEHVLSWGITDEPRVNLNFQKGEWKRVWAWIKGRTDSTGEIYLWQMGDDGVNLIYDGDETKTHCDASDMYHQVAFNGYGRASSNSHPTFDDVYVATGINSRARVEIGNNPVYENCNKLAITTPTSWSDGTIRATMRTGNFNSGEQAYLFVVDADGIPSPGYPITIGTDSVTEPISDNQPPIISNTNPTGVLNAGTSSAYLTLETNENANCRYSTNSGLSYGSMTNSFSNTGSTSHSTSILGLNNGQAYTYYVKCRDSSGNENSNDKIIAFSIDSVALSGEPHVANVIGVFDEKNTITITGLGFGAKINPEPLKFDDFENGALGRPVSDNGWDVSENADPEDLLPIFTDDYSVSGTQSAVAQFKGGSNEGNGDASNFGLRKRYAMPKIYLDTWVYFPNNAPYGRNIKMFRIQPMEYFRNNDPNQGKNGNMYLQLFCDSYDHIILEQDGVTDGIPGPGADIWKYLYNYNTGYFEDKWTHIQLYTEESSMGVADGTARLWIDGKKEVDKTNAWKTREIGSSYWATIWLGNYYSTYGADGCAQYNYDPKIYYDNVYIDITSARIEIGDNQNYDLCTHREIQIPSGWSDSSITITANTGSFLEGDNLYLFVVDEDGTVSNGFPILVGEDSSYPAVISTYSLADLNQDLNINATEVNLYIDEWKTSDIISLSDVLGVIRIWDTGGTY